MNHNKTHNWINYYRNSLADGEMLDIRTRDCENGFFFDAFKDLNPKSLLSVYDEYYKSIKRNKRKSESKEEDEEKFPIEVFISPLYLNPPSLHGKKTDNYKTVFPFWIPAMLSPSGELSVSPEENRLPWFMRSVLEPVFTDTSYFPIVSSVKEIDGVLDSFKYNTDTWKEYWKSAENFFERSTGSKYADFVIEGYNTKNKICIIKAKSVVTAQNILRVYDDLKIESSFPTLVSKLLNFGNSNRRSIPSSNELFLRKGHYGQYNNQFPLSTSQRQSLMLFEQEDSGKILAVNGPPGTGKTTLLQSIVANEMVKAALEGELPPRIVASSTNNQAITNILDSFKSGGAIERWIPNIDSLGSYLISSDTIKQDEAREKGYQILTRTDNMLDGYYFNIINNNETAKVEKYYIDKFTEKYTGFTDSSVESIVVFLHKRIKEKSNQIDIILDRIDKYYQAENQHFPLNNLPEFKQGIEQLESKLSVLESDRENLLSFYNRYNQFREKNRFQIFFTFIASIKRSYQRKLSLFLTDSPTSKLRSQSSNKGVELVLLESIKSIDEQIPQLKDEIRNKTQLFNKLSKIKEEFDNTKVNLLREWEEYLKTKNASDQEKIENDFRKLDFIEQANQILDVSIRNNVFIDAIHYWEGKWIIEHCDEVISQNKGLPSKVKIFTQISYLTPLFISTFHSLPGYCSFFEKTTDTWIQKPIYEIFDLIIVDEAGQVSPEVGVASFSLAKRALVVGDIHQIEPIWNIAFKKVDMGNLNENQLLNNVSFDDLENLGVLCSSGSLMHLARNASAYEVNSKMGGTILTEHRRCVDELVEFSNEFVYQNMLIPKIGKLKNDDRRIIFNEIDIQLPPLSYINVRGHSEKRLGSTYNPTEAQAIAKWVMKYGDAIVNHFNREKPKDKRSEIKDCIAVVTPFAEQKREIYHYFEEFGIDTEITVGTVHALQGAERPLVIFSPTYGINHEGGQLFFDIGYNMLNVALTRAKKHFVVIGNMKLFNSENKYHPSGGLAKYLFADEMNELSSSFLYDDITIDIKSRVDSLERHQKCIQRTFDIAKDRVIIVSPFISIKAIDSDGIIEKIRQSVKKNVRVTVYTDKFLDMPYGKLKPASNEGRKALADAGAELIILNGIHNKALAKDEDLLIEGSFNWLSAIRDTTSPHYRFDVSHIIQDSEAKKQIQQLLDELEKFAER